MTLVVPVFKNYSEPVEIRISAFELMLYTDPITLDFLIEILHNEPYNQVSSYIYSTLKTYANSTQPCDYKMYCAFPLYYLPVILLYVKLKVFKFLNVFFRAKLSRKLLAVLEPKKFGLHYSNQVYYDYYNGNAH